MNAVVFEKEVKETFAASKGTLMLFTISLLYSALDLSYVTIPDLAVTAQVEVLDVFTKLILGLSLALAVILTAMSFATEKEQKTLEAVLLTTISKQALVWGKIGGALVMTFAVALIGLPYVFALGYGHGGLGIVLLNFVAVTLLTTVLVAALSAALTILMGSTRNGMFILLALLGVMAVPSLLEFKVLGTGGIGAFIDRLSPISNAILAIREVVVTRGAFTVDAESALAILGLWLAGALILLTFVARRFEFSEGD